ncbi:hypothetical protein Tco_0053170 [Tanacetum coccineum]
METRLFLRLVGFLLLLSLWWVSQKLGIFEIRPIFGRFVDNRESIDDSLEGSIIDSSKGKEADGQLLEGGEYVLSKAMIHRFLRRHALEFLIRLRDGKRVVRLSTEWFECS